jgi:hypothetical protein
MEVPCIQRTLKLRYLDSHPANDTYESFLSELWARHPSNASGRREKDNSTQNEKQPNEVDNSITIALQNRRYLLRIVFQGNFAH